MNSLYRLLTILDLYDDTRSVLSVEEMGQALGYTRSTLYRYLKVLTDRGLLAAHGGQGFSLGPRVAELNRSLSVGDPFLVAGRQQMTALLSHQRGFALVCRRFRDAVVVMHAATSGAAVPDDFEAGRRCCPARHAAARIVMAQMGVGQLRRLYAGAGPAFSAAGMGDSLADVRASIKTIRERGHDVEHSPNGAGLTVVAVPVVSSDDMVLGSLALGVDGGQLSDKRLATLVRKLSEAAVTIRAQAAV